MTDHRKVIRDIDGVMLHHGSFSEATVDLRYGDIALSAIGLATAEDMLVALRGVVPELLAKQIVGILLDHGLTHDSTLDALGGAL